MDFKLALCAFLSCCAFSVPAKSAEPKPTEQFAPTEWLVEVEPASELSKELENAQSKSYVSTKAGRVRVVRRLFDGLTKKHFSPKLPQQSHIVVVEATAEQIREWSKTQQLAHVELNYTFKPFGSVLSEQAPGKSNPPLPELTDPLLDQQWHLSKTGFDQVWAQIPEVNDIRGRVLVFVADTWVDPTHGDLKIANFVDPQSERTGQVPFHGTHVAGTISSWANNGYGGSGAIWDATIVPVEVCGLSFCDTSRIVEAITMAADFRPELEYAGQPVPRVINLSLGSTGYSYQMARAIEYAQSKGVVVVAAAGNSQAPVLAFYPASYPDVISVGATDPSDSLAWFSNYGPRSLTITAPGTQILAPVPAAATGYLQENAVPIVGTEFALLDGTSMAAPLVTAAAAMVRAFRPDLRQDEVRRVLTSSGQTIAATPFQGIYKRLDVPAALRESATVKSGPRAANNIEEDVVVDVQRTCHTGYNPAQPCENCIQISGRMGSSDRSSVRIRWLFFSILPVYPETIFLTEVQHDQNFYEEIPYTIPDTPYAGIRISTNFHFLTGFVEDVDVNGEVRSLRPIRFSDGQTFFDIGRTPCR